ncbi:hypothetical protein V8C42DRAFT_163832 [Trichoderma barbatum]
MFRVQGPSWKLGSLDDMLAEPLRYLRPKEIFIDFQALKKGDHHFFLLILRAKLFDVCSALDLFKLKKGDHCFCISTTLGQTVAGDHTSRSRKIGPVQNP